MTTTMATDPIECKNSVNVSNSWVSLPHHSTVKDEVSSHRFTLLLVTTLVVVLWICKTRGSTSLRSRKRSPTFLTRFSEIPSLPVFGPIFHVFKHRKDLLGLAREWSEKYGQTWHTRVMGRDIFFIHNPSMLKELLSSTNIGHLERYQPAYKNISVGVSENGLISMSATKWTSHRKVLNSLFTYDALKSYIPIYMKHAEEMAQILKTYVEIPSHGFSDTKSYTALVHSTCLNIITEISTGVSFDALLGRNGAIKFQEDVKQILNINGNKIDVKPWLQIPLLWYFNPEKKKLDGHVNSIESAIKHIRSSYSPQPESKFALDLMINSNWSDAETMSELMTFIMAGHETVSSTFKFLLWMLALEEDHQTACQIEIDQVFDSIENSGVVMTMSHVNSMRYLERCIKETLRLFPVVTAGTIRSIRSPLEIDDGVILQSGDIITFYPSVLHRDPSIYPEPEKFDPSRFLPENVRNRHPYAYLPFSAGSRNCIGWKAALLELKALSAVIIRNFKLCTTDRREDIRTIPKMVFHTSKEPTILFKKRR